MDGKLLTEKLIAYAKAHLYLAEEDEVYLRNVLLSQFGFSEPYDGEPDVSDAVQADVPDLLAAQLKELGLSIDEREP